MTKVPPLRPCGYQMFTLGEAIEISRLSRGTLYNHMKSGKLKSVLVGDRRLIPHGALRELLQVDAAE